MVIKTLIIDLHGVLIEKFPREEYKKRVIELLDKEGFFPNTYELWKSEGTITSKMERYNLKEKYFKVLDSLPTLEQKDEELISLLEKIKLNLIIATNTTDKNAYETLVSANIPLSLFKSIITAEDVSKGKPNTEMYSFILDLFNLKPENCLVIGDRMTDIIPAGKLGMSAILCDYQTFKEILRWIGKRKKG